MYNRYIHQQDGSYQRKAVQDPPQPAKSQPPLEAPSAPPISRDSNHIPVPGFFRNILPKDFDTGDLIVVLLLLLMAGDCQEDRNTALLTLALYFFM